MYYSNSRILVVMSAMMIKRLRLKCPNNGKPPVSDSVALAYMSRMYSALLSVRMSEKRREDRIAQRNTSGCKNATYH